jgi:hypothetical protein
MKKLNEIFGIIILTSFMLTSCGGNSTSNVAKTIQENNVDVCRCLTEPGNSEWNQKNSNACRDAISKEIGVDNWEKINMSQNPGVSAKFDVLVKKCSPKNEIGKEVSDQNKKLITNIGTTSGFIWESINIESQIYTTLAFDDLIFRSTAYSMNGKTNSNDFSKLIDLSGSWNSVDSYNAKGIISLNNVSVGWTFSSDFLSATNNKGVVFKRVKVK